MFSVKKMLAELEDFQIDFKWDFTSWSAFKKNNLFAEIFAVFSSTTLANFAV